MAAAEPRIRNSGWEEDEILKAGLEKYVLQSLSRKEILDFVKRDFPHYAWSLGTLSRRLAYFDIKYVQYNIDLHMAFRSGQNYMNFANILKLYTEHIKSLDMKSNRANSSSNLKK